MISYILLQKFFDRLVNALGMQDVFGESGSAAALVEKYGLDAKGVYKSVKEFL